MDEYIKRKPLIEEISSLSVTLCGNEIFGTLAKHSVVKMIYEQPAADVVEVVRCKDCEYGEQYDEEIEDWRECRYDGCGLVYEISHFCSYGKRKGGEGE